MALIQRIIEIDLEKYQIKESKIYSGRDFGKEVRRKEQIDKLDLTEDYFIFIFPDDIKYVADSFTLGLLGKSYIQLDENAFLKKYKYETKSMSSVYREFIHEDFNRGLSYIKNFSKDIL